MSAAKNIFLMLFLTYWAGHNLAIVNAADDKTVELANNEGRVNVISEDVTIADRLNPIMDDYKKYLR